MKRLGLAVAFVLLCAASAAGAMSKAQAKKVIADHGLPEAADGILIVLNTSMETAPLVVEAYLTLGTRADREITYPTDDQQTLTRYPLTYLLMFSCADETTAAMAKLLVDAGADPNTTDPENDRAALSQAHACPDVIRVLLEAPKKPDVNRVDRNGNTAMHLVIRFGGDRQVESIRMLLGAGFDIARWRAELLKEARNNGPLQALGLVDLLSGRLHSGTAVAKTQSLVLAIQADDFFDLLSNNIDVVKSLFRHLIQRMDRMTLREDRFS